MSLWLSDDMVGVEEPIKLEKNPLMITQYFGGKK